MPGGPPNGWVTKEADEGYMHCQVLDIWANIPSMGPVHVKTKRL